MARCAASSGTRYAPDHGDNHGPCESLRWRPASKTHAVLTSVSHRGRRYSDLSGRAACRTENARSIRWCTDRRDGHDGTSAYGAVGRYDQVHSLELVSKEQPVACVLLPVLRKLDDNIASRLRWRSTMQLLVADEGGFRRFTTEAAMRELTRRPCEACTHDRHCTAARRTARRA